MIGWIKSLLGIGVDVAGGWWIKPAIYGGFLLALVCGVWSYTLWQRGIGRADGMAQAQQAIRASDQAAARALDANQADAASIATLRNANAALIHECQADPKADAAAEASVAATTQGLQADVVADRKRRGKVYAQSPSSAVWSLERVPAAIADEFMRDPAPATSDPAH